MSQLRKLVFPDTLEHRAEMQPSFEKDLAYAMTPLKILSWPVGTWPLQEYNVASALRTIITVSVLLLTLVVLYMETYLDGKDAEKNLDCVLLVSGTILAVWKVTQFRVRREGLVSNFDSAVNDYKELETGEIRAIVRRHAYMGRMATASVIFFSYLGSTLFTTLPMLAGDKEQAQNVNATKEKKFTFPIPSEYALEVVHAPEKLYPVIYIIEYIMLLVISTGNLGSDSMIFSIIFHLCGQAEVLKLKFTKPLNEKENITRRFDILITRHQHLLKLSKQLSDTISTVLVIQLFSSCLLICTSGFELILALNVNNVVMAGKTSMVVSTLLTQMFAYSYLGDYLKDQMEGIGYSAYCCRWYDLPNQLSRNIIFIRMRSQVPVHLKAGDFFVVNMETYMSIVKTSMSYLSILRVMVAT